VIFRTSAFHKVTIQISNDDNQLKLILIFLILILAEFQKGLSMKDVSSTVPTIIDDGSNSTMIVEERSLANKVIRCTFFSALAILGISGNSLASNSQLFS